MPDDADAPRRRNPYAVPEHPPERPADPGPGGPGGQDRRGPEDGRGRGRPPGRRDRDRPPAGRSPAEREAARRMHRLALLGLLSCVAAISLPPAGVGMGLLTGFLVTRARRDAATRGAAPAGTLVALGSASFAVVAGVLLSVLMLWLAPELGELRRCLAGANTRTAEQQCQDAFREALLDRVPTG